MKHVLGVVAVLVVLALAAGMYMDIAILTTMVITHVLDALSFIDGEPSRGGAIMLVLMVFGGFALALWVPVKFVEWAGVQVGRVIDRLEREEHARQQSDP